MVNVEKGPPKKAQLGFEILKFFCDVK